MPVICVNPSNSSDKEIVDGLSKQNEDLRLFLSDKLEDSFRSSLPGKKAIGDILDDTHISTASSGAFCGVFFEDKDAKLRNIFINAIEDSSLKTDSFDIFSPCLSVYDQNLSLLGFLTQVRFQ